MKTLLSFALVLFATFQKPQPPSPVVHEATYKFINGQWFDGKQFQKKDMYSVNGIWKENVKSKIDSVIDLKNQYVVPPFSEAHTHLLEGIGDMDKTIKRYLQHGIFYVKNPNNVKPWTDKLRDKINNHKSLDASFANGGLTSSGGHPENLYEDQVRKHLGELIGETERGWFNNKSYFTINNEKDLDEKWPIIKEGKPDFIKVYLANTDNVAAKVSGKNIPMRKGLDPSMLPVIVKRAHKDGYRVSCHVETAADFRLATQGGVNEINHTPGFYIYAKEVADAYRLTKKDAQDAARKNITVVTTLLSRNLNEDKEVLPLVDEIQGANLKFLYNEGVRIAIGSDHAESSVPEIMALYNLKVFDNLTLLKMWCENSALAIFPQRKIGYLKADYEASCVVLEKNPLESFEAVKNISVRFKQGHFIKI